MSASITGYKVAGLYAGPNWLPASRARQEQANRISKSCDHGFRFYTEVRSAPTGEPLGDWARSQWPSYWQGSIRGNGVSGVDLEYRFRHPIPRLTNYLKIDWTICGGYYSDPNPPGAVYDYTFVSAELPPVSQLMGLATPGLEPFVYAQYLKRSANLNTNITGERTPQVTTPWTRKPSEVLILPQSNFTNDNSVRNRIWFDTWCRKDLDYAELINEVPTQSPRRRFQPVFFENNQFDFYGIGITGNENMRAVKAWVSLDDTGSVYQVFGATLRDPVTLQSIRGTPILKGGGIDTLGPMPTPVKSWNGDSVPYSSVSIFPQPNLFGAYSGRGRVTSPGMVFQTPIEYIWDGSTPPDYNPLNVETWPLSPVYTASVAASDTYQVASTRPFYYLRPTDIPTPIPT